MKFTEASVAAFTCPADKASVMVFDTQLTGFGLKATARGSRIFIFQFWDGAGVRRVTIGRFGDITLPAARRIATTLRGQVAAGANPAQEKRDRIATAKKIAKNDALTLRVLIDRWEAIALRDRSEGYKAEATRALRRAFAKQIDRPAASLDGAAVQAVIDGVALQHPATARRLRAYMHAVCAWAVRRSLLPSNPCATVVAEGRDASRDRVLSDAELGEAWRAAGRLNATSRAFVRLSMLTLQRRSEVAGMRWSELSADREVWTLPAPRAKNRKAHIVHLVPAARAELKALPHSAAIDLVFATKARSDKPTSVSVSGFSDVRAKLHEAIRIERGEKAKPRRKKGEGGYKRAAAVVDWTPHDFRRTGVTVLAGLGVPPHVADRLLNHVQGTIRGVAAVYQRNEFLAERKAALELWAAHIENAAAVVAVGETVS